ncbi:MULTISPECIES: glutathione S-transferase family protein [unclassified Photorhabdus]|uniref:glutathione S-transferase family protein n=1 Tax=unclassified Photorhabdus TaxID=2620880 RepID=UPI000DCDF061|nr:MULTISPECIES: glutathione S-transferase [unclassified Photorhabdus]RAW95146.1 glutathione S-transferase [Photorhabdus sp. S9-53]RAW95313.1 glutathione S-transferase [Photorhabdus sp. S10-54]RAW99439.1 glutathione S-transferase [Photorhabdus sp. S8-52]
MLTIWGRKNSSNVKKVLWCLKELGVPYNQVDIGGKFGKLDDPQYLKMNPNGKIPCLQEGDFILWESNSIVRYLAAKFGKDILYPQDLQEKANADKWMDWVGSHLFPYIRQLMIGFIRTPEAERDQKQIEQTLAEIEKLMKMVENTLAEQKYLSGDKFGMADIALGPMIYPWLNIPIKRPSLPNIERWYQLMAERPAFKEIVMIELS